MGQKDTVTKWVLWARAGEYYYQVSMGSWDWAIQSQGKCGQLEPKDTINVWVRSDVAGGYSQQVSTIS